MSNPLEEFTQQAVKVFGNSASKDFYAKLGTDGHPSATRCTGCAKVSYPPREHCPACFGGEVEWVKEVCIMSSSFWVLPPTSHWIGSFRYHHIEFKGKRYSVSSTTS